jgi:hypothetical protein
MTGSFEKVNKNKNCQEKNERNLMEQNTLKNINNCSNTNIYSYLETSGGQSCNLYVNVVYFFNTIVY